MLFKVRVCKAIQWRAYPEGDYVYSSGRDVTKEIKMNQELNQKNDELNRLAEELQQANTMLKSMAITDKLTGLHNRHYFDERIIEEMEYSERYGTPLSMFIYDLDHFKSVNDTFGHPIGDDVLIHHALLLKQHVRKMDLPIRMGGEEFALLMPNTSLKDAKKLAEKIRIVFENTINPVVGKVTASFGVAERFKSETYKSWYKRIDEALYTAKEKGRNQVVSYNMEEMPIAKIQIIWKPESNSGNSIIDAQHKEILELATVIFNSSYSKVDLEIKIQQINDLLDHIENHFKQEEAILKQVGFDKLEAHQNIHENLLSKSFQLKAEVLVGKIKATVFFSFILDQVIVNHFTKEDIKFFPYVKS